MKLSCISNWRLDWFYLAFVTIHWTPANWLLMSFSSLTLGGRIHTLTRPPWGQVIVLWCLLWRRPGRVTFCMCLHTTNVVRPLNGYKKSLHFILRVEYSSLCAAGSSFMSVNSCERRSLIPAFLPCRWSNPVKSTTSLPVCHTLRQNISRVPCSWKMLTWQS